MRISNTAQERDLEKRFGFVRVGPSDLIAQEHNRPAMKPLPPLQQEAEKIRQQLKEAGTEATKEFVDRWEKQLQPELAG